VWPGRPVTAHRGVEDPAAASGGPSRLLARASRGSVGIGYASLMLSWRVALLVVALAALLAAYLIERSKPSAATHAEPGSVPSEPLVQERPAVPPAAAPLVPDLVEAPGADQAVAALPQPERTEPEPIPLENLLRVPQGGPLETDRNPHLRAPEPDAAAEAARPSLRERVRVGHRSEQAGVPGPRERTVGQTDASVSVPVKDSVNLRGGVRVDSRREGDGALEDVEPAPSVGIDVRF